MQSVIDPKQALNLEFAFTPICDRVVPNLYFIHKQQIHQITSIKFITQLQNQQLHNSYELTYDYTTHM